MGLHSDTSVSPGPGTDHPQGEGLVLRSHSPNAGSCLGTVPPMSHAPALSYPLLLAVSAIYISPAWLQWVCSIPAETRTPQQPWQGREHPMLPPNYEPRTRRLGSRRKQAGRFPCKCMSLECKIKEAKGKINRMGRAKQ